MLSITRASLARRIDRIAPPGPVLDVGSGDGTLLDALAARRRDRLGLERGASRDDVREADISAIGGKWAAVVFWHSLEHLTDPKGALTHAVRLLAPGGVLIVAVPNLASYQAKIFGARWFALDLPRHLVHLPAETLLGGLREVGLTVERVSFWRGGQNAYGWLDGLVGLLPGHPSLWNAIRRPEARYRDVSPAARGAILYAATLLAPLAVTSAAVEILSQLGGTIYVEARSG